MPALPRLLAMRDALQRSVDVYRPMASTVKERMQNAEFLDVSGNASYNTLQACTHKQAT